MDPGRIAIVGMACRYPDANTPDELWENVLAKRRAFRRLPAGRLPAGDYCSPNVDTPDLTYSATAAVLDGYEFDRVKYRVSAATFRSVDLAHWLALDVANDALADAGFADGAGLPRVTTGTLVGNTLTGEFSRAAALRVRWPYVRRVIDAWLAGTGESPSSRDASLRELESAYKAPFPPIDAETLAGSLSNTIAGRICNYFNLKGGGYTVDGACASSQLAVVHACSALTTGDLDVAIAGGVDLSLDPFELVGFAKAGALARDAMRVFDARPTGFWPGEGCGFVVLMREADAIATDRRIRAVIRGWGVASDGSGGMTRPQVEGQMLALERAYRRAGFPASAVPYFEGHGTGTAAGDAAELAALSNIRADGANAIVPAVIGSVKANIGHTKAAAGIAGLLKVVKTLEEQVLPPATACEQPHPALNNAAAALEAATVARAWPQEAPLRAGVSAMGFGGINVHLAVEAAPAAIRRADSAATLSRYAAWQDAELFVVAADDSRALSARLAALKDVVDHLSMSELTDLAVYLQSTCGHGGARAAMVASTPAELAAHLERACSVAARGDRWIASDGAVAVATHTSTPRIAFLFPGQGAPVRTGGGLWAARFASAAKLYRDAALPGVFSADATAIAQPAIITSSLAAAAVCEWLGLRADVAIGHSLGEIAAMSWAGAFSPAEAINFAKTRGRLMQAIPGAMAAIQAPLNIAASITDGTGAVLAAINAPNQFVVAGEVAAIEDVIARAHARALPSARLTVAHPFHSPLMQPIADSLAEALTAVPVSAMSGRVISTVTGAAIPAHTEVKSLLVRQLTEPVRFAEALAAAGDVDLFMELGPGHTLTTLTTAITSAEVVAVDSGGVTLRPLLRAVGTAFALGADVNLARLAEGRFARPFDIGRRRAFLVNPCELAAGAADRTPLLPDPARVVPRMPPAGTDLPAESPAPDRAAAHVTCTEICGHLRDIVSRRTELPLTAVTASSRFLSDLHLNSITVAELLQQTAADLNLGTLRAPTDYADAMLVEAAEALHAAGAAATPDPREEDAPPGLDSWVRAFAMRDQQQPLAPQSSVRSTGPWCVIAAPGHPLAERLASLFNEAAGGPGTIVCVDGGLEGPVAMLLDAAKEALRAPTPQRFVVVQQDAGVTGFVRSLYLEARRFDVAVITLDFTSEHAVDWIRQEAIAVEGFLDVRYDAEGRRWVQRAEAIVIPDSGSAPLGPNDLVLVTGGGKGIAAECAAALARRTGVRLLIMGRSLPHEDPVLSRNIQRLRQVAPVVEYVAADVTDGESVRKVLQDVNREHGNITAIVHAAGVNEPALVTAVSGGTVEATLAVKVGGAQNVLAAIDTAGLRMFVSFGSVIARTGLPGEAHYALANERLRMFTERIGRELPHCRALTIEWSVWAATGMGERLGRLDGLARYGVTPIDIPAGVDMFMRLLSDGGPDGSVMVAGRLGTRSTLQFAGEPLPFLRFLESPRVYGPQVELIADATLTPATDPYLSDHCINGQAIVPAVIGLEAMAQCGMALRGTTTLPVFENVEFHRAIVAAADGPTTIRLLAFSEPDGSVRAAVRSATTAFAIDHFSVVCRWPAGADRRAAGVEFAPTLETAPAATPPPSATSLYGSLFFQSGRFARIQGYRELSSTRCVADIGSGAAAWFGAYLPPALVLGDPGARDAAVHAVQATVPQQRLLPVSVGRITIRRPLTGPCQVRARQQHEDGRDYVWDLDIVDATGAIVEVWSTVRLRALEPIQVSADALQLLGPYLERRLPALGHAGAPRVLCVEARQRGGGDDAIRRLLGGDVVLHRRIDGKPEVSGNAVSTSHTGALTLAVAASVPIGCDVETIQQRSSAVWRYVLGPARADVGEWIAREGAESSSAAGTRVWTAIESLKKAGAPPDLALTVASDMADGWVTLRAGRYRVSTWVPRGRADGIALAIATEDTACPASSIDTASPSKTATSPAMSITSTT